MLTDFHNSFATRLRRKLVEPPTQI